MNLIVRRRVLPHRRRSPRWSGSRSPAADLPGTLRPAASRSRTSARPSCSPPATGSRSTRRSPASTAASATSAPCWPSTPASRRPSWPPTSTCTTTRPRSGTSFRVAAGLDSMVVGEAQILGQLRDAYHAATEADTAGRLLHELMQQALRVGKRAHAETGIDQAGQSVVTAALDVAAAHFAGGLAGRPALVVGAGAMGALSRRHADPRRRRPAAVTNRGADRAARLADAYGATAVADRRPGRACWPRSTSWSPPPRPPSRCSPARPSRPRCAAGRPLVVLDLAVPRDVAPDVADLPGVVVDRHRHARPPSCAPLPAAADERRGRAASSTPRSRRSSPGCAAPTSRRPWPPCAPGPTRWSPPSCAGCASAGRTSTEEQRAEVARTVHRVVQRLLHSPTVRVRQLAAEPGGDQYAALLRELFDLDVPADRAGRRRAAEIGGDAAMTTAAAPRHPGQRARAGPVQAGRRRADRAPPAGPVELVRDRHRRRPLDRAGRPARRRRLRLRAARRADRRRDRLRRALVQGPAHRRQPAACTSPPCRRARTRATRWSPATACTLTELPDGATDRHRRAAPDRAAATLCGLQLQVTPIRGNVDTRLRGCSARRPTSTRSSWPGPAWPGSAGPTRSPRRSTRC